MPMLYALVGDIIKSGGAGTMYPTPEWGRNLPSPVDIFVYDFMLIGPQIGGGGNWKWVCILRNPLSELRCVSTL